MFAAIYFNPTKTPNKQESKQLQTSTNKKNVFSMIGHFFGLAFILLSGTQHS